MVPKKRRRKKFKMMENNLSRRLMDNRNQNLWTMQLGKGRMGLVKTRKFSL